MSGSAGSDDRQWVVVDTDTGLDDAHSLLYLLAQPDVDVLGITTIYGNCEVEDSARNVAYVLDVAERGDIPIYGGADRPLEGEPSIAWFVHGRDGLGDRGLTGPQPVLQDESAADFLVRIANEHPGRVDLHPLGPLTNIALALEKDPDLLRKFRSVVIMGGAGPYPAPGEATVTDANTANDRLAAERVFRAPNDGNVVMVGVNVTSHALLEEHVTTQLLASDLPWARFAGTTLDAYNDFYQYKWGRRISAAHDGLASVVLHRPEIVTGWIEGPVDFTPHGGSLATRIALTHEGYPLVFGTPEGPTVRAVTSFDLREFRRRFVHALAYGTTRGALDA
ncbi:nucleoside hydrolase [Microbacterium betulae]|uniref:Nucleoside hydrolase n=1 Tax=Microbacterium betulae TaxID=2981139 RepID=A0AA97FHI4_9MICO|nr:nucleoside hydrolase [Microbacterium sp. AB]WOF22788.1 nucleoside hydrolase [Microbacterium sp. AB]